MTATVITDAPQGSTEWLAARAAGITGTDIGALLGANPWRSPLDVWLSKQPDHTPDAPGEPAQWGHRLEPVVRDHYAVVHPDAVVEEVPGLLAHPDEPLLRGSLDGLAHTRAESVVLEVKCSRQSWADDYLPDAYLMQGLWYCGISGLDACHVAVLTAGQAYSERIIAADPAWFNAAADRALDWWTRHVAAGVMPDPDPVRDGPKLARLWTPDPGASVELDSALIERLRDTRAAAAAARTDYEVAVAAVQAEMREATAATVAGDVVARWSAVKPRTTVDVAALKADGIYDRYSLTGEPSRRFTVSSL